MRVGGSLRVVAVVVVVVVAAVVVGLGKITGPFCKHNMNVGCMLNYHILRGILIPRMKKVNMGCLGPFV